jgi:hypothetical protein
MWREAKMIKAFHPLQVGVMFGMFTWLILPEVVPPSSVIGWETFPKASKRDEIG